MPMRRHPFARIVEIAAVNRQDVRNPGMFCQGIADGAGGHGEMGVDHIEALTPHQLFAATDRHGHIGEERGKAARCLSSPAENGHANNMRAVFLALFREVEGARCQHRHVVTLGQLLDELGCDDTTTATERRVFVVTDQNVHFEATQGNDAIRSKRRLTCSSATVPFDGVEKLASGCSIQRTDGTLPPSVFRRLSDRFARLTARSRLPDRDVQPLGGRPE